MQTAGFVSPELENLHKSFVTSHKISAYAVIFQVQALSVKTVFVKYSTTQRNPWPTIIGANVPALPLITFERWKNKFPTFAHSTTRAYIVHIIAQLVVLQLRGSPIKMPHILPSGQFLQSPTLGLTY